jgi:putative restriction endonuclease
MLAKTDGRHQYEGAFPKEHSMGVDFSTLRIGREYDRPGLAELWGYEGFQAISRGVVTPSGTNYIIFFVTKEKQSALTQYADYLDGQTLHWEGEDKHGSDGRIIRAKEQGDEIHLFYREIHHSPFTYHGQIRLVSSKLRLDAPSSFVFTLNQSDPQTTLLDDLNACRASYETLPETQRTAVTQSRIGQGLFRERVIQLWQTCAVTGLADPLFLRASHIKPWRDSTNAERLDPRNGLLLHPTLDLLFDKGSISFADSGRIMIASGIDPKTLSLLGVRADMALRKMPDGIRSYLSLHRADIFRGC